MVVIFSISQQGCEDDSASLGWFATARFRRSQILNDRIGAAKMVYLLYHES